LQTIRSRIELYNVQNPANWYDAATPLATFWDPLVQGGYLQTEPINPLTPNPRVNDPRAVAAAAAAGGAWVWAEDPANPPWFTIYAIDQDGNLFSDPDTGRPY
jgi:hypothetical protein